MTRPTARTNRLLATVLFLEGAGVFAAGFMAHSATARLAYAFQVVVLLPYNLMFVAYPLLVGTLPTPMVAWLRTRVASWIALAAGAVLSVVLMTGSHRFVIGVHPVTYAHFDGAFSAESSLIFLGFSLFLLFALAAAIHAWTTSPKGSQRRTRAGWFALAFGARDLVLLTSLVWFSVTTHLPTVVALGPPIALFLQAPLLTYGLLKHQVLDIDLKIKLGISRTTVAAIIAGAALVGSEVLERAVGADPLWAAAVVGAVTSLAFRPLARLGDRVADRAMPGVENTAAYRADRTKDIYRAALEGAISDGRIDLVERDVLVRLQRSLGLSDREAHRLELGVRDRA